MRRSSFFAAAVMLGLFLPATALAQERAHAVSAEALDDIVAAHASALAAERAELHSFLQRPEVREIAGDAGIDIATAETAVASLSADEIRLLSGQVAQVDAALAGGDSVVVSTTAIILGLLILIIILVA